MMLPGFFQAQSIWGDAGNCMGTVHSSLDPWALHSPYNVLWKAHCGLGEGSVLRTAGSGWKLRVP